MTFESIITWILMSFFPRRKMSDAERISREKYGILQPAFHPEHHRFFNVKRDGNGMWSLFIGGQWIPCGTWERVLLMFGGHA